MRISKLIISASVAISAIVGIGAASAADLPARTYTKAPAPVIKPVYNWTGFYFGGNVGGMWTNQSANWPGSAPVLVTSFNHNTSAGIGGAHIGYQYQWNSFVLGIEAAWFDNFNGGAITGSPPSGCPNPIFTCQAMLSSIWTVGPRAGFVSNNWLLYGTGGYANGDIGTRSVLTATSAVFDNLSARQGGWFAGVGVEYAAWKTASFTGIVGVEYQHIDLGTDRFFSPGDGGVFGVNTRDIKTTSDLVRLRLSLKFNPMGTPVVAKY
jgi:outer membrane immunogenic protein